MPAIDLDFLVGEPLDVTLAGITYKLPSDCPIPVALKTQHLAEQLTASEQGEEIDPEQQGKLINDLYETILALFQVHQPDLQSVPLTTTQMLLFTRQVYGGGVQLEGDEAAPPPVPKSGGRKKTPPQSTT